MAGTSRLHPTKSEVLCGALEVYFHTKNQGIQHAILKILQSCYFEYFGHA